MKKLIYLLTTTTLFVAPFHAFGQSTVKWEETFATPGVFPEGWEIINNDGSPTHPWAGFDSWFFSPGLNDSQGNPEVRPHAGAMMVVSSYFHANANGLIDEWLIGPQIEHIETGDSLHFYAGAPDTNFKDSLRVFVSTSDIALASFSHQLAHFKLDGPKGVFHRYSFDLSPFAGSDIYFAVNFYLTDAGDNGSSGNQPYVDHFIITGSAVTGVAEHHPVDGFSLAQNYPNPFPSGAASRGWGNPETTIRFELARVSNVKLAIYDIRGRLVRTIANTNLAAGSHQVVWNGRDANSARVASGIYIYKIIAGDFSASRRMLLLE